MTRTDDDIKKGLECCFAPREEEPCRQCPYAPNNGYCVDKKSRDALALIQRQEWENFELAERIKQLEAERDAAVKDIRLAFTMHLGACNTCLHFEDRLVCDAANICALCEDKECVCNNCYNDCSNWQWRGIQKGDLNDDHT